MPILHWLTKDDDTHATSRAPYRLITRTSSAVIFPEEYATTTARYALTKSSMKKSASKKGASECKKPRPF